MGPQAVRDQHLHGQTALDVHRRSRDQQLPYLQRGKGLLRDRRREPLRDQCAHWASGLAGAGTCSLRTARVLLCDADDRLRPRLHRERGRDAVCVRRVERPPALGAAGRHLHLHGSGGVAAPRLRRHLRRLLHRLQRGDRRPALAFRGVVGNSRRAERRQRHRVLRRLPAVRQRRFPLREARRARHLRAERADRQAHVALAGWCLQPCRRRQQPPLRRRPLAGLQLRAEESASPLSAGKHESNKRSGQRPNEVRVLEDAGEVQEGEDRDGEARGADPQPS